MAVTGLILSFRVGAPNVSVVVSVTYCGCILPWWTGSVKTHPKAFQILRLLYCISWEAKQISNPPLYPPSPLLVNNWRTKWCCLRCYKTVRRDLPPLIYVLKVKDKLWACLRKYDSPKMEHDNHCQRDRLKLLECHCFVTSQIFDSSGVTAANLSDPCVASFLYNKVVTFLSRG